MGLQGDQRSEGIKVPDSRTTENQTGEDTVDNTGKRTQVEKVGSIRAGGETGERG